MPAIQMFAMNAKAKLHKFFKEEKGEVNIVTMVVLIGIAVLLAIVFKDAIKGLIEDLLEGISGKAKSVTEITP